ncbi:hypothetical protein D9615_010031 [Tricholomella constricta]|uniref:Uncharacterized protein n=1 Tax=Tricholomella constricta TaxID=117010 RepID=A0A8H5GTQ7_9AGAR|nr:hypothetical protein D9615_010031 [Tricholomella constricta]
MSSPAFMSSPSFMSDSPETSSSYSHNYPPLGRTLYSADLWTGRPDQRTEGSTSGSGRFEGSNQIAKQNFFPANRSNTDPWAAIVTSRIEILTKENHQLQKDVQFLHRMLSESHQELIGLIRTSSSTVAAAIERLSLSSGTSSLAPLTDHSVALPLPVLDKEDYPDVKYWTKKEYTAAKKRRKSSTGLIPSDGNGNVMTWYVEMEEGEPVDTATVEAIRAHARSIWQSLRTWNIAPATWADASLEAHNYFEHHMCRQFPLLSYGANNWKAHMIATENYPSWYSKHVGRSANVRGTLVHALQRSQIVPRLTRSPPTDRSRSRPDAPTQASVYILTHFLSLPLTPCARPMLIPTT